MLPPEFSQYPGNSNRNLRRELSWTESVAIGSEFWSMI